MHELIANIITAAIEILLAVVIVGFMVAVMYFFDWLFSL